MGPVDEIERVLGLGLLVQASCEIRVSCLQVECVQFGKEIENRVVNLDRNILGKNEQIVRARRVFLPGHDPERLQRLFHGQVTEEKRIGVTPLLEQVLGRIEIVLRSGFPVLGLDGGIHAALPFLLSPKIAMENIRT